MKVIVILATVLLAGCAVSSHQVRERGTSQLLNSSQTPKLIASCMERNAKAQRMQSVIRNGEAPLDLEFIASSFYDGRANAVAVADIKAIDDGSRIFLSVRPDVYTPDRFASLLMAGC